MVYNFKREMMIKIAKEFSQKVNLPFRLEMFFDEETIMIGDCKKNNDSDCVGRWMIPSLIEKYSFMTDNQFFKYYNDMLTTSYEGYKDLKKDPNYKEKI